MSGSPLADKEKEHHGMAADSEGATTLEKDGHGGRLVASKRGQDVAARGERVPLAKAGQWEAVFGRGYSVSVEWESDKNASVLSAIV